MDPRGKMTKAGSAPGPYRVHWRIGLAFLVGVCLIPAVWCSAAESIPAQFLRDVRVPGDGDGILRPSALVFDSEHGELLVADPGNNRVVIFSAKGAFRYAFTLGEKVSAPRSLAVDPGGRIHVLGSSPQGPVLLTFDFDGLPLEQIPMPAASDGREVRVESIVCDDQGRLFCLDGAGLRILEITGQWRTVVDLVPQVAADDGPLSGFGTLTWDRGEFLLPVSTAGFVLRYAADGGEFLGAIGHAGTNPGALAFPVAVQRTPSGCFLVLDTNRFCIVCYGPDGTFRGEFGGKGLSPGWFVNPTLLAVNGPDSVVVGQIFHNRIQIVALPPFALAGNQGAALNRQPWSANAGCAPVATALARPLPRRSSQQPEFSFVHGAPSGLPLLFEVSLLEATA